MCSSFAKRACVFFFLKHRILLPVCLPSAYLRAGSVYSVFIIAIARVFFSQE